MADGQDLLFLLAVSLKKASPVEKWAEVRDTSPPLWLVCRNSKHGIIRCVVGGGGAHKMCCLYPALCKEATGAQCVPVPEGLAFVCPDGWPRAQPRTPHPGAQPLPSYPPLPARPPRLSKSALLCPTQAEAACQPLQAWAGSAGAVRKQDQLSCAVALSVLWSPPAIPVCREKSQDGHSWMCAGLIRCPGGPAAPPQQVAGSRGFLEARLGPGAGSTVPGRPDGGTGCTPVAFPTPERGILNLTCARPTLPSL